jgi:hypothetical protein
MENLMPRLQFHALNSHQILVFDEAQSPYIAAFVYSFSFFLFFFGMTLLLARQVFYY